MALRVQRYAPVVASFMVLGVAATAGGPVQAQPGPTASHHVFLPVTLRATVLAPPRLDEWSYYRTAQVLAVALDESNDVVWAGTDAGAVRWDRRTGTRETFTTRDGLASDIVSDVALAADGGVWLAHGRPGDPVEVTAGAGVSHRTPDGRWTALTIADGLSSNTVYAVERAPDGSIWFGTSSAASRLSPDGHWSYPKDPSVTGPGDGWHSFRGLAFDRSGNLWVGSARGVSRLATDGTWRQYLGFPNDGRAMAADAAGNAWFSRSMGVTVLQPGAETFTFTTENGLHSPFIKALAVDGADNRWFASYDGISRLGPDGRTWSYYVDQNAYASLNIEDIAVDTTGRPWIGTLGHVQWLGADGRWQSLPTAVQLGSNQVTDIVLDAAGRPWVAVTASGFSPGGVSTQGDDGMWTFYDPVAAAHPGEAVTCNWCGVYGLARGPDGSLWVATTTGAVRRRPDGTWTHYTRESGLATNEVRAVEVDRAGGVWFANTEERGERGAGVSHLTPDGQWEHYGAASGLASDYIHIIAASPTGDVWFARWDGISVRSPAGDWRLIHSVTDDIYCVTIAPDGHAWVGTTKGVYELGPDGTVLSRYTKADGLPITYFAGAVAVDAEGAVWVGTDGGAVRRSPDGRWMPYIGPGETPATAGRWNQVSAIAFSPRGTVWLGTGTGVAALR
jgi:ligand-binding sensor domain-containing protein